MRNINLFKEFKRSLIDNGFIGDVCDDTANIVLNSTDNSIYEVKPIGVIMPKNNLDVLLICKIASQPNYHTLTFTARGGGTGTNGQSLNNGVIVDTSRYMTNIIEFDNINHTITVEPGVVLSSLNQFLQPHGLFFPPEVSTKNRATIGGMIANDSAGKGSMIYGKTSDYVLELECVLINGECINIHPVDIILDKKNNPPEDNNNKLHNIATEIYDLITPVQDEIERVFPKISRPLSGYNLKILSEDNKVDITKIISGSEGTLTFITKAKLKALPMPKHSALVITHYNNFIDALKDAEFLIKHNPSSIETIDEVVQKGAMGLPSWPDIAKIMGISPNANFISNFTEFTAFTMDELNSKVNTLINSLQNSPLHTDIKHVVIYDTQDISQVYNMRSMAVGLVGRTTNHKKPIAFIEDAIVPPENLTNFVIELKQLLDGYNLQYAMYGHTDVGCIHVRPALDMTDPNDKNMIRELTTHVVSLCDKYHGILWGEHGKGYRGEFVEHTFGDVLYPILQHIKSMFDPDNRMNPGKLVTPFVKDNFKYDAVSVIKVTPIDEVTLRGDLDRDILQDSTILNKFQDALICNGNAACFNQDKTNVMCPSYKVTNNRIHSPKGRAMLTKEWLRNKDTFGEHHPITKNSALAAFNAMSGCLDCKGCTGKCPTMVSIPHLKTNFYHEYYKIYKNKSIKTQLMEYMENIISFGGKVPKISNFIIQMGLPKIFGLINLPLYSINKPIDKICKDNGILIYDGTSDIPNIQNTVLIILDVITGYLDHNILLSTVALIKKLGGSPIVALPQVSGKTMLINGNIESFTKYATQNMLFLSKAIERDILIAGIENTTTLLYRDEYKKFGISDTIGQKVHTIAEALLKLMQKNPIKDIATNKTTNNTTNKIYYLLPHCTEQAICPIDAKAWQQIFEKLGVRCNILNLGCCGMAGNYGHQSANINNSEKLFDMHWRETVIHHKDNECYMATGYSCRTQSKHLANVSLHHPISVIVDILDFLHNL